MHPGTEYIAYARAVGANIARSRNQPELADDLASEAVCALLTEWPVVVRRYGPEPGMQIIGGVISHRVTDWLRGEYGRRNRKLHADALPLEYGDGNVFDIPDVVDVATEACADRRDVDDLIDLVALAVDDRHQAQTETICRMIADGIPYARIGDELGVSEARVCQLVDDLGVRVRSHAYLRSVLMPVA